MAYDIDEFNKVLAGINSKIDNLALNDEEKTALMEGLKNSFENRSSAQMQRLETFEEELKTLKGMLENSDNENISRFFEELRRMEEGFKNEILSISSDKDQVFEDLKNGMAALYQKTSAFEETYPEKNLESLNSLKSQLEELIQKVQDDVNGHIKTDYDMLAQAIGALYGSLEKLKSDVTSSNTQSIHKLTDCVHTANTNKTEIVSKIDELMAILNNLNAQNGKFQDSLDTTDGRIGEILSGITFGAVDRNQIKEMISTNGNKVDEVTQNLTKSALDREQILGSLITANSKIDEISLNVRTNLSNQISDLKNDIAVAVDRVEMIKGEIAQTEKDYLSQIMTGVRESAGMISEFKENTASHLSEYLYAIKDALAAFSEDMRVSQENITSDVLGKKAEEIKKLSEDIENLDESLKLNLSEQLKSVEDKLVDCSEKHKFETIEKISEITDLINGLLDSVKDLSGENLNVLKEKLISLEAELKDNYSTYETNLNLIQEKIGQYISSVENISKDTNLKLENSFEEVVSLKDEVGAVREKLNSFNDIKTETLDEYFSNVVDKIGEITSQIENYKSGMGENIKISMQENIDFVDKGLGYISTNLTDLKENQNNSRKEILENLEEKISEIKTEFSLVKTDVVNALTENGENLVKEFEGVKSALDKFSELDFEKFTDEMKNQIQLSYLNLIAEIKDELSQGADTYGKIEASYKDIVARVSGLETSVSDFTEENFELVKNVINKIDANVSAVLEKNNEISENWKSTIEELNNQIRENQKEYEHSLVNLLEQVEGTLDEKLLTSQKDLQEWISGILENNEIVQILKDNSQETFDRLEALKMQVEEGFVMNDSSQRVVESVKKVLGETIDTLNEKFTSLDQKVDVIAMADNTELFDAIDESSEKINSILNSVKTELDGVSVALAAKDYEVVVKDCENIQSSLEQLHSKIDAIALNGSEEKLDYVSVACKNIQDLLGEVQKKVASLEDDNANKISAFTEKFEKSLTDLNTKVDVLAMADNSELEDLVATSTQKLQDSVTDLHTKVDVLAMADNSELEDLISDSSQNLSDRIDELHSKVDILAADDNSYLEESIDDIRDLIQEQQSLFSTLDNSDDKIAKMLELLQDKVEALANTDVSEIKDEIHSIKDLIEYQKEYFEKYTDDEKSQEISSHLQTLIGDISKIEKNVSEIDLEKNSQDIKDSVMTAILSAMDQVSFVEETEEIKDFVEEKTNAINETLLDVKKQLTNISNAGNSDMDFYSYSLQDVESDLAKLRLTLNELSANPSSNDEVGVISANIGRMAKSIEQLQADLKNKEADGALQTDFEKLKEDILSLSVRTNKILLNSDNSQKFITDTLDDFTQKTTNLQDKLEDLANNKLDARLSVIENTVKENASTSKRLQSVMTYLGEWMDGTTEAISNIQETTAQTSTVTEMIETLKSEIPNQAEILEAVEVKFEEQQAKIDNLEQKLEKVLEKLSALDENVINTKIDKLDEKLDRLSMNIEKLTAYVDEE
ncbi:MAG: hypothetical protein MRZ62_08055 [Brachyspira sp.]|nr:hypothetical protein [Brachyspira sp.]